MSTFYARCHQRGTLYNYYKVTSTPSGVEVEAVSFLNKIPHLRTESYTNSTPSGRIEIEALTRYYPRISEEMYRKAFKKATKGKFQIYLNGKPVGDDLPI